MKRLAVILISAVTIVSLSACDSPAVQADAWQDFYDYLGENGPIELEEESRTFRLEKKGEDIISVGVYAELNYLGYGGNSEFVIDIPHDMQMEECPITLSSTYRYLGFVATEDGVGTLNRTTYQSGDPITWNSHDITEEVDAAFSEEIATTVTSAIIAFLDTSLGESELEISMSDLGFLAYESSAEE